MFSNLSKNQHIFVIDKRDEGALKIGVVDEIKPQNPYQLNYGVQQSLPFDIVVKYEDGSVETFPQLAPSQSVFTYNNGDVIVCDSREVTQAEIEKIHVYSQKHLDLVPHFEKLLASTEIMMRQLSPNYAKQQETDEKIKNLEDSMNQMSGTLVEVKGMMERMIAGISSSKKSNN